MSYYFEGHSDSELSPSDPAMCTDCEREIDQDDLEEYEFCGECLQVICSQCGVECVECNKVYETSRRYSYLEGKKCCKSLCMETCKKCNKSVHRICEGRHTTNCNTLTQSVDVYTSAKLIYVKKEKALSNSQAELERLQKLIPDQIKELEIARQDVAEAQVRMEAEKAKKPAPQQRRVLRTRKCKVAGK